MKRRTRRFVGVALVAILASTWGCERDDAPARSTTAWRQVAPPAAPPAEPVASEHLESPLGELVDLGDHGHYLVLRNDAPLLPPVAPALDALDENERFAHDLMFDIACEYMALVDGSPFTIYGVEGRSLNRLEADRLAEVLELHSAVDHTRSLLRRLAIPRSGLDLVIPRERCPDEPLAVEGVDLDHPVDARLTRAVTQLACAHHVVDPTRPRVEVEVRAIRRDRQLAAVTNYAVRTLPEGRRIESSRNDNTTFGRVLTTRVDERDAMKSPRDPLLPVEVIRRAIYPKVEDCTWAETGAPIPAEVAERHCAVHPEASSCQGALSP